MKGFANSQNEDARTEETNEWDFGAPNFST